MSSSCLKCRKNSGSEKVFNIAKNLKHDGYQRGLASMVYKLFDKKLPVEQLTMELYLIKN